MKKWPKSKSEPAPFDELISPIKFSVRFAYELNRKNIGKNIPYEGYDAGEIVGLSDPPANEKLSAEGLQWVEEDQGMDALDVLVDLAVQVGIEQGKRIERAKFQERMALGLSEVYQPELKKQFGRICRFILRG